MSDFSKLVDAAVEGKLDEVSPPGFKGTVKAMKKRHSDEIDNPWALSWWMKKKGYKSHKKATGGPKEESVSETVLTADHGGEDYNQIANDWHGGQGSPLYSFAHSGGKIHSEKHRSGIIWEIDACIDHLKTAKKSEPATGEVRDQYEDREKQFEIARLMRLKQYIEGHHIGDMDENLGAGSSITTPSTGSAPSPVMAINPTNTLPTAEEIRVEHPSKGFGTVLEINEDDIVVEWDRLNLSILGPERMEFNEAQYLFRVKESYTGDPDDAEIDPDEDEKDKKKKHLKVKEQDLSTEKGAEAADTEWDNRMAEDPADAPPQEDYVRPKDGVSGIIDLGVNDNMKDKAHRSDNRRKSTEASEQTMAKDKKRLDEHMVAIKGTYLGNTPYGQEKVYVDLSMDDLVEYELPDPGDSILTGDSQKGSEKSAPLSTERGAEAAHNDVKPDGDYGNDLVPDDAPDVPGWDKLGDEGGNPRDTGSGDVGADLSANTAKSSDSGDSDGGYNFNKKDDSDSDDSDSGEDKEDDKVKESNLTWEDLGLVAEGCDECSGGYYEDEGMPMMQEHELGASEVALSCDLLSKLLTAVRDQSPDDSKLEAICSGIEAAGNKEDRTLGVEDIGAIMSEIKSAYSGGGEPNEPEPAPDAGDEYGEEPTPSSVGAEAEGDDDVRDDGQSHGGDDDEGVRDDDHGEKADDNEYEDKAEGDGEKAGPEGGKEHEGKTKLMDQDGEVGLEEGKGGNSETEIGSLAKGSGKGEGGSKNIPPIGTKGKGSGPGGGNTDQFGQGPEGNTISPIKSGSSEEVPGKPLSPEGGGKTVPPISESAVAMGKIGYTYKGNDDRDLDGLSDDEKEIAMIKRRAGMENWWKK